MKSYYLLCILLLAIAFSSILSTQPAYAHEEPMIDNSTIIIGGDYNYHPYEYLDKDGNPTGYNVDLTRAIARIMGFDVEIRLGPWGEIRESLESGSIDAIHGMFYSEERNKLVDFSPPHTIIHHSIFAREDSPKIESVEDLRGKEIIVMQGDIMHDYVIENNLSDKIALVETQSDALRLLSSGKHDCALIAKLPGFYWIKELKLSNIETVGKSITQELFCYAVTEGNAELLSRFNEGLAIIKNTGQYDKIYEKWFGVLEPRGISRKALIKYSALVLIPLILFLIGFMLWSQSLRKQVAARTKHLKREVEEHKKAEEQINQQNELLNNTIESLTHPFYVIDVNDYTIKMANSAAAVDNVTENATCYALTHKRNEPCDDAEHPCPLKEVKRLKETVVVEHIHYDKDGNAHHYEVHGFPIFDSDGNVIQMIEYSLDITEREIMEEALKKEKEFSNNIIETADMLIIGFDLEGKVTLFNRKAEKVTGYSRTEVIGNDFFEIIFKGKEEPNLERMFGEVAAGKISSPQDITLINKNGEERIIYSRGAVLKDRNGSIIGVLGTGADVTELRSMQQRTLKAEKLKSLGELAGGVAHDFNNVLAAILGRAQLMKMAMESPPGKGEKRRAVQELKHGLDVIEQASRDGAETVRRIQEFARKREDDKYLVNVDLNEIINNALDFTRTKWKSEAESKGIQFNIQKELSTLPLILGSASELR